MDLLSVTNILDLPPALVDDVCFGMAPLPEIFEKFGLDAGTAERFRNDVRFQRLITLRTAELEKDGVTHKVRVGRLADKAMRAMMMRLDDTSVPLSVVNDIYKAAAKNAGFEPKAAEVPVGAGFSINIIFPDQNKPQNVTPVTIDVTPVQRPMLNSAEFEVV